MELINHRRIEVSNKSQSDWITFSGSRGASYGAAVIFAIILGLLSMLVPIPTDSIIATKIITFVIVACIIFSLVLPLALHANSGRVRINLSRQVIEGSGHSYPFSSISRAALVRVKENYFNLGAVGSRYELLLYVPGVVKPGRVFIDHRSRAASQHLGGLTVAVEAMVSLPETVTTHGSKWRPQTGYSIEDVGRKEILATINDRRMN